MTATVLPAIADHMTYIVVCASRSGARYVVERDLERCDKASTIEDIARGEFDRLVQVLECNPVEHVCSDVTADLARDVMTVWANEGEPLLRFQRDFVEQHVGMSAAAAFPREREDA